MGPFFLGHEAIPRDGAYMAVELKPGSASAQVHKEAAAAVASPEFRKVASDFSGGGSGEDEPAPAPPPAEAPDTDEGPSPEPEPAAAPAPDPSMDTDDDYDEEDRAVAAPTDDDDEGRSTPAVAAEPDHRKTWDQYKTDDERAKALHQNKTYGIEMARKAKALEDEVARLKAGRGAEPAPESGRTAPPPAAETVETTLRRLMESDPQVGTAVQALSDQRNDIASKTRQIDELTKSISDKETAVLKARNVIEYLEERAKAEPDNFELTETIQKKRNEVTALETAVNSGTIKLHRLELDGERLQDRYREGLSRVREYASGVAKGTEAKAREDAAFKANYDKADKDWDASLPKVFGKFKIVNPKIQKKVNVMLLRAAALEPDDIANIETWMLAQGNEIHELLEEQRAETLKGYKGAKDRDAFQPAPSGAAAVATPQVGVPRSSREADRLAGRMLKESLAGARR